MGEEILQEESSGDFVAEARTRVIISPTQLHEKLSEAKLDIWFLCYDTATRRAKIYRYRSCRRHILVMHCSSTSAMLLSPI